MLLKFGYLFGEKKGGAPRRARRTRAMQWPRPYGYGNEELKPGNNIFSSVQKRQNTKNAKGPEIHMCNNRKLCKDPYDKFCD